MKAQHLLVILALGSLVFNCKKDDVIEPPIQISSPQDSSFVNDTVPIIFSVNPNLNIIRTECYVDFYLFESFDNVPSKINFISNNFEKGSIHNYNLKIFTKDGNTYSSNIITLIISKLSKPIVTFNFISKSAIELTWSDNSNNEDGFRVNRKEGSKDFVLIGDLANNITSFTDNNIDTTKIYTYEIEVYSAFDKLTSDPNIVSYTNTKYVFYKDLIVPESTNGKIAISPDGNQIVVTNYRGNQFTVVNVNDGSNTDLTQVGGSFGLAMSHSGSFFAITGGSSYTNLSVWDLNTLSLKRNINKGNNSSFALCINKTDEKIVDGGEPINIFYTTDGSLFKNINQGNSFTRDVCYSNDESLLLTCGNDDFVKLWNASTGALVKSFSGHTGHVGSVSFNLDETQILSGSYEDNTIKFWEVNTGKLLKSINIGYPVVSIHKIGDGSFVIATSDGAIRVINQDGQILQSFGESSNLFSID